MSVVGKAQTRSVVRRRVAGARQACTVKMKTNDGTVGFNQVAEMFCVGNKGRVNDHRSASDLIAASTAPYSGGCGRTETGV